MKYVIDLPDGEQVIFMRKKGMNIIVPKDREMVVFDEDNPLGGVVKLAPYEEPSGTADDVWEMMRHVLKDTATGGMSWDDIEDCFGTNTISGIAEMSYAEVREKYDAWKKKKGEIKVGDEIYNNEYTERKGVIILDLGDCCTFMEADGRVHVLDKSKACKTGRHFHEVAELLKKMRETE